MFNNFAYLTKIFRKRSLNNNKYDPQTVQLLHFIRALKHIIQLRYNFVDSLEWNTFIKTTFPKFKSEAKFDNLKEPLHEPTELICFVNDNVVRLSMNLR